MLANNITFDTKLINFQFKITHRIIACGYQLNKWKIIDSDMCPICHTEQDTIEHFFILCTQTEVFWKQVFNWWTSISKLYFFVDVYEIIFGIPNENKNPVINHLNFIILSGKYYIYTCKKCEKPLDLFEFLLDCKSRLNTKYDIMQLKNPQKFDKYWRELYDMF